MNLWNCQHAGCDRTCCGVGGAVGLRAIGWYFKRGPIIFCPEHRPDGINGKGKYLDCHKKNCPQCKGSQEAEKWQALINKEATR